jgi:hypothetical protein
LDYDQIVQHAITSYIGLVALLSAVQANFLIILGMMENPVMEMCLKWLEKMMMATFINVAVVDIRFEANNGWRVSG